MTLPSAAPLAAVGSTDRWQEQFFAPYVDMGLYPVPDLDGLAKKYGVGLFSLGFMQASPSGKLAWAGLDALSLDSNHEQALAILGEITALRAAGGDVMVSLGGAAGQSLAQAYAQRGLGVQALATAYGEMVDSLKLSKLDFDIEGAALAETQTIKLQMEAIALVQQSHPALGVWLTLPVLPQGLTQDGLNTVKAALQAGVQVDGVNVMAMDYGDGPAPPQLKSMGAYAIDAANTTFAQLSNLFASQGKSFGWNQLGVTPMLGVNDISSEVFTIQDAEQLEVFAREKGLGMLSMWSINRDNPGAAGQASNNHAGLPTIAAGGFSSVWGDYGSDPVISSVAPVVIPPVVSPPVVTPPVVGNGGLSVEVGGSRWWGGFTAELKITNSSGKDLQSWSYTFDSPHSISGAPWGATVTSTALGNGISRYTLSGAGWAAALKAGASVSVGFNGSQGSSIGNDGALTSAQLFSSSPSTVLPTPPVVTPPVTPIDSGAGAGNGTGYAEALQKSFLFYEANRSGDLDGATNRVPWRGDSGLNDGRDGVYFGDRNAANLQLGLSLDLTGGYYDAGDHGKFGMPLASTISSLAWGGIAFKQGYNATGQLDELLAAVKWGTDYLLKAHGTDATGNTSFFVAQVGDGAADHALWSAPESQTIARPAMAVTAQKPGSDVTAGSAAALASASILFRENGSIAYADELLRHAQSLYRFADTYRGKYSDSITEVQGYYNSWSGYEDELSYGAAWLARATEAAGGDGSAYRQKALQLYNTEIGGLSNGWTQNWDDSSYGAAVLLAEDTGNAKIRSDVEGWLNSWVNGSNGVQITAGGLRFISQWGSLRYAANTAMLAGVYADSVTDPNGAYSQLATDTIDYILGDNPRNSSYEVGYGENSPQQPHHRAASGVGWDGFRNGLPNENILYGALVGGPSQANDFAYTDVRSDYIGNEVAIDYNSGFTGALAFAAQRSAGF